MSFELFRLVRDRKKPSTVSLRNRLSSFRAKAKEKAGITKTKKIRFYDIHHFYITYALANGANITELAERVGHVDATMVVKVYAHLAEDLKTKRAFEVLKLRFSTPTIDKTVARTKEGLAEIS